MTEDTGNRFCPYVGLRPYTERDRAYFFGRERDTRVIAANLYAARLTVLYGASGVGKSSVLLAGVLPRLLGSPRTAAVVFRDWQSDHFAEQLKSDCLNAVRAATENEIAVDTQLPLDDFLQALGRAFGGTVLLLFDQFEEYFLYHAADAGGTAFDTQLARAINRDDLDANVLISLREDGLAGMDRFRARIPNLLTNMLRLDHIDLDSAEAAIRKPVGVYNERNRGDAAPVEIEDSLVRAVLDQVRAGRVQVGDRRGVGRTDDRPASNRIETPFLQLVLERLWEEDVGGGARRLRLSTFERLGGAQEIVSSHLDRVMRQLTESEMAACAAFFDRLVTPSGSKIAYNISDLVQLAGGDEKRVDGVIRKLTDSRILRPIESGGGSKVRQVEIFHDVMAPAILSWLAQFRQKQEEAAARRRRRRWIAQVAVILLLVAGFVGYRYYELWLELRPWAYLENLATGKVYEMTGDPVPIGRSTGNFTNRIGFKPGTISRKHLMIFKGGAAHDIRSRNGTTVNGLFLPYGNVRHLKQGDIITLAGLAPLRYHAIRYGPFQFWKPSIPATKPPADAWALVLDGPRRQVSYLTATRYHLSLDTRGRVVVRASNADKSGLALMEVRRSADGRITIKDLDDDVRLIVRAKEGDYDYPSYYAPSGIELDRFNTRKEQHDLFEITYRYRNTLFQLIPIVPDLE